MADALILAFDTSAAHCAAALLLGERIIGTAHEPMEKGQAERLMPMLETLLTANSHSFRDVTAIAVGTGPGNFTGVRIAVAAARGLALGLGIPAIGVTRLEAVAHGHSRPLTVMIDARRDEVYVQSFTDTPQPARIAPTNAPGEIIGTVITGDTAADRLTIAIARIAATRLTAPQPRPAPFYLRGADAAPSSDPGPVILPEAS